MCLSVSPSIAFRICSFDPAWSIWTSSFILNEPARIYPTYSFWQRKTVKLFVHTLVRNINMPAHISNNSFTFYLKPPKNLENNEPSSRKSEKRWGSPGRKAKINTGFLCVCVCQINNSKNTPETGWPCSTGPFEWSGPPEIPEPPERVTVVSSLPWPSLTVRLSSTLWHTQTKCSSKRRQNY